MPRELMFSPLHYQRTSCLSVSSVEGWGRQNTFPLVMEWQAQWQCSDCRTACLPERCCSRVCSAKMSLSTPPTAHLNPHAAPDTASFALSWVTRSKAPCPYSFDFYAGTTVTTKSKAAGFISLMMQLGSLTSWSISYLLRKKPTRRRVFRRKICLHK